MDIESIKNADFSAKKDVFIDKTCMILTSLASVAISAVIGYYQGRRLQETIKKTSREPQK